MKKYYVKMNGKVFNVPEETYLSFKNEIKDNKEKSLCSTCRVSNCSKITYKNINYCKEVSDAMCIVDESERILYNGTKENVYNVIEFLVFDCKMYQKFKELLKKSKEEITAERQAERKKSIQNRLYEEERYRKEQSKNMNSKLEQLNRDSEYKKILQYRKEHEEENIEEKIEQLAKGRQKSPKVSNSGVIVKGIDNCLVKLSKCCNPIPGDKIVGFVSKGQGIKIHRADCPNVKSVAKGRLIDVYWDYPNIEQKRFNVDLEVVGLDRPNLLSDIVTCLSQVKVNILKINANIMDLDAHIRLTLSVENAEILQNTIDNMNKVQGVAEIRRVIH